MNRKYVLVINQVAARLFSSERNNASLASVWEVSHPDGRLKDSELNSDGPGKMNDAGGPHKSALEPNVSAKDTETQRFIKQIVISLKQLTVEGPVELVVIAGPKMLGMLRPELSKVSAIAVSNEIGKDLPNATSQEISDYLTRTPLP